MNMITNAIATH